METRTSVIPTPRVVIGVPLYNNAPNLRQALESLMVQTYPEYAIVLVDDCSSDASRDIALQYVSLDPRLTYERNEERLGMIGNWRRAFEAAERVHPGFEYFAWGSDHDVWHPRWIATLVAELEGRPEAVLAYPFNDALTDDGVIDREPWSFETSGIDVAEERLELTIREMSAGNMIYGLTRAEALRRCGVFKHVLLPDRLLLTQLALLGQFRQARAVLWTRRQRSGPVQLVARQRQAFFPGRRPPLYSYLPWFVVHSAVVAWSLVVGRGRPNGLGRLRAARLATMYLRTTTAFERGRQVRRLRQRLRRRAVPTVKRLQRGLAVERELPEPSIAPAPLGKQPKARVGTKGEAKKKRRKERKPKTSIAAAKDQR